MINVEFVREWILALRNGKYKQGRIYLRDKDDKYCCWGVACELGKIIPTTDNYSAYCYKGNVSTPPFSIRCKSGLNFDQYCLTVAMNDCGKTFEEIADYLEDQLKINEYSCLPDRSKISKAA